GRAPRAAPPGDPAPRVHAKPCRLRSGGNLGSKPAEAADSRPRDRRGAAFPPAFQRQVPAMPLLSLPEYKRQAALAHGHLCAGQILGLRLAMYGMRLLGIDDPAGADRKRLITYVEIDRCATDAIAVVTGCRLGKRALKFLDFGKVAATFCDLSSERAARVVARESARGRARELYPDIADKNQQQMRAYREMPDEELFEN